MTERDPRSTDPQLVSRVAETVVLGDTQVQDHSRDTIDDPSADPETPSDEVTAELELSQFESGDGDSIAVRTAEVPTVHIQLSTAASEAELTAIVAVLLRTLEQPSRESIATDDKVALTVSRQSVPIQSLLRYDSQSLDCSWQLVGRERTLRRSPDGW